MLGTLLAFQFPGAIVLRIFPATVELVNLLLALRLDLFKSEHRVRYMQKIDSKALNSAFLYNNDLI